jgi:hypothetical protein
MAHDKQLQPGAEAQEDEPLLDFGVVWIFDEPRPVIVEDGLGFVEAHTVLLDVGFGLRVVPLEVKCSRGSNVTTM